jgi:hypothetical protein
MNEKIKTEQRRDIIIDTVKNPLSRLEGGKSKGCLAAILYLIDVRSELQHDSSYSIEGPDPLFKQFYTASNDTPEYYEALVSMLQGAGFSREEVSSAVFEFLSVQAIEHEEIRPHIRFISGLFDGALTKAFRQ